MGNSAKSLPHERLESDRLIQEISDVKFGWYFFAVFLLAAYLFRRHSFLIPVFCSFAAICAVAAFFAPHKLRLFKKYWLKLGEVLALIVTPIVLSVFFFLIFTPFGFLLRALGVLSSFQNRANKKSYWQERDVQRQDDKYYFKQQF